MTDEEDLKFLRMKDEMLHYKEMYETYAKILVARDLEIKSLRQELGYKA